ncbi:MAG: phospho-sugar mutase [Candidatus Methylacidiphilales bacterium]
MEMAVAEGKLLPTAAQQVEAYLARPDLAAWEQASLEELIERGEWTELNDRFFRRLAFGTGGLRGRTIARVVTAVEQGTPTPLGRPEHPAAGTNVMNDYNVARAVRGLVAYVRKAFPGERPRLVFSHDTRHFSREFAELAAGLVREMGGMCYLFAEDRSTPELSFAVRHLKAHAGAMITASHNPPHDNGFKVYFSDGAQVVEPVASGIIAEVNAVKGPLGPDDRLEGGGITFLGQELDEAYLQALAGTVLEPEVIRAQAGSLKLVFTGIHGTGTRIAPRVLARFGFDFSEVAAQREGDGRFPTVTSPNPENAEALSMAIAQAKEEGADVVLATDPDADRMGVAVRDRAGEFVLLSGNQIGSLLASYRLERMQAKGWITPENASRAALIKTFVTTDLQKAIATAYGVKCIDTLTGFKYIGAKLRDYEMEAGGRGDCDDATWRHRLLERSTFFVFGGEESYGYLTGDFARDKDANAAVLAFAEAAAFARSQGKTLLDVLDELYLRHGFYLERLGTLTFEGAEGAAKIQRLVQSFKSEPPTSLGGRVLERVQNFQDDPQVDADGKPIPKELMLLFHYAGGARMAVRASGTEPKIKFYFFVRRDVGRSENLPSVKAEAKAELDHFWKEIRALAESRVGT